MKKGINLDKNIQAGIERNARQGWLEYNMARENAMRKAKRKETILAIFVGAFIIVATTLILISNSKLTQDAKESCMSSGHSESYCMERI